MRVRDGNNSDPGWKKVGSGINIPDPQHWDPGYQNDADPCVFGSARLAGK